MKTLYIYIGGVMVSSVLASSAVDRGFDPRSGEACRVKRNIRQFDYNYSLFVDL
jgi:hypothetical protein